MNENNYKKGIIKYKGEFNMIDLHIHTTHSDGQMSVKEILDKAKENNIKVISFCDHNVVGAYKELEGMDLKEYNIKVITGIELNFVFNNNNLHMLGYDFDWKEMSKSKYINNKSEEEIIKDENKKLEFLKDVCKKQGIKVDDNLKINKSNELASTVIKYHMMEFKENDKILDEMLGKNREKSFARGYVHNPNTPFFIDETKGLPSVNEVADLIHSCKGKVVLAHPFEYKILDGKKYIDDIFKLGFLDGIECMHTRHNLEQVEYIKDFCKKNKLMITGGSDFHRESKQRLGYGVNGTVPIDEEYLFKTF